VTRAHRAAFLVDGEAFFTALAAALERARHQVILLGWDFHGSVRLRRDSRRRSLPDDFMGLLEALLERRPGLEIYVLGWSYGIARAIVRELAPRLHLGLHAHPRLHFRLDADHPLLASHHQKIVAIDDAIAFSGGFDVTTSRWDTRAHLPHDGRRVAPGGRRYGPFHDVQMAVDGDAAAALAELARERWLRATAERLAPPPPATHDAWPVELAPSVRQVEVGISRTEPGHRRTPVREVETLFVESIAAARRTIYAESQYLTSDRLVEALAARLAERSGPEVVIVNPQRSPAWLEAMTIGVLRAHAVHRLRAADRHARLGLFYPRLPSGACLNVHSKVTMIDDRLARIGSANLANRSMALDTECDLAIESNGRADLARAIAALRDDLLAEHLGTTEARVREAVRAHRGSVLAAIAALRGGERSLEPLRVSKPGLATAIVGWTGLADPGAPSAVAERLASRPRRAAHPWLRIAGPAALLAAAAAALCAALA
jgi:phosphatidylserine/phosphatidylglycerophosphate/cardiolipin synthase-like enzyme